MGSVYFGPLKALYFRNVNRMGLSRNPLIRLLIDNNYKLDLLLGRIINYSQIGYPMGEIHGDIIQGDLSDAKNLDSWIRRNKYCCKKVKEYMCSIIDSQSESGLDNIKSIRDMNCEDLRQVLEFVNSKSPQMDLENPESHVSTIIEIWDECMALKDDKWIEKMS